MGQEQPLCKIILTAVFGLMLATACTKKDEGSSSDPVAASPSTRYLYVVSGLCYSGFGMTSFTAATASNIIFRINTDNGLTPDAYPIADYFAPPAAGGDSPVAIVDWDSNYFMVLVETTSGRRIEKVEKKSKGARSSFSTNTTALSGVLRRMVKGSDGSLYVSKSTAIEKFNNLGQRQTSGANPWVNAPGGSCATSTTMMSGLALTSNDKLIYTHAAAAQNRIGVIASTGYSLAANCLATQAAPAAGAAYPTQAVYIASSNQLLVSYGNSSNAVDLNSVWVYTIDESTGAISGATKILDSTTNAPYLFGISSMTYDSIGKHLYIATANGTSATVQNYNIEKFKYDPVLMTATRVGTTPFVASNNDTKCIVDMTVGY